MDWLHRAGIRVTCFYLAPSPFHPNPGWMRTRDDLAKKGWGFIPTYIGEQAYKTIPHTKTKIPNPDLTREKGKRDGQDTAQLMHAAEFPSGPSSISIWRKESRQPAPIRTTSWPGRIRWTRPATFRPSTARAMCCWSLERAKVVWLARPQNVDRNGNIVPQVVDPDHLPAGSPEPNTIATQALFEVEFQGLDQPREDGHAPRFDLSYCAVADPSDLASVDEALRILPGSKPRDEEAVA